MVCFRLYLFAGEVLFEKRGDSVLVKIEKLKLLRYEHGGFDRDAISELTEQKNMEMQAMLQKLKERIEMLFNKFRG